MEVVPPSIVSGPLLAAWATGPHAFVSSRWIWGVESFVLNVCGDIYCSVGSCSPILQPDEPLYIFTMSSVFALVLFLFQMLTCL